MKKKMVKTRILQILILSFTFLICEVPVKAATETYKVKVTYQQSEARGMLDMVNDFRTGSDAWQWSESGERVEVTGLNPLVYDYNLERIAMIRAKELVALYSHTRPNGTSCFTAYTGSYGWKAENIAIGTCNMSSEEVFTLWREENEGYSGQGHRRNMLNSRLGAIGIAHVYYNGCHYWVQEFGDTANDTTFVAANDSETEVELSVDSAKLEKTVSVPGGTVSVSVGGSQEIPKAAIKIRMKGTWASAPPLAEEEIETLSWTSSDESVLKVDGNTMTGVKNGEAEVTAVYNGTRLKVNVKVGWGNDTLLPGSDGDLKSAGVSRIEESFTYNGKEHKPVITSVSYNWEPLTLGKDYTITYKDNINAGTGRVIISGIGNYKGSTERTFRIYEADISKARGTVSQEKGADGKYGSPVLTLYYDTVLLIEGQDYISETKKSSDGKTVVMYGYGRGNYTGQYVSVSYSLLGENDLGSGDDKEPDDSDIEDSDNGEGTVSPSIKIGKKKYTFKYSGKKRSFILPVKVRGGKVVYKSNKSAVRVNRKGKVTIAGKFSGKAYISVIVKGNHGTKVSRKILIKVRK